MAEFARPPLKQGKIAPPVPLSQVPPEKQDEYKELAKAAAAVKAEDEGVIAEKIDDGPDSAAPMPETEAEKITIADTILTLSPDGRITAVDRIKLADDDPAMPTDEDKQEFLRSILGPHAYRKTYTLFGSVPVIMCDRSVDLTERVFKDVEAAKPESDAETVSLIEQYVMAATVVRLNKDDLGPSGDFAARLSIFKASRPMYQALMQTSREFERHVEFLTGKALDTGFWKAGGAA